MVRNGERVRRKSSPDRLGRTGLWLKGLLGDNSKVGKKDDEGGDEEVLAMKSSLDSPFYSIVSINIHTS